MRGAVAEEAARRIHLEEAVHRIEGDTREAAFAVFTPQFAAVSPRHGAQ
jgi:hypothetical protein